MLRPENYENRRQVVIDYAEHVRQLWRGEKISVLDGVGKEQRGAASTRRRSSAELPIWVTSAGGVDTFRNAGRIGAGLLTHLLGQDLDDLADEDRRVPQGRDGAEGRTAGPATSC